MADTISCSPENSMQQADATQAYVQALLEGVGIKPTYIHLPMDAWPEEWLPENRAKKGLPPLRRPVVRLLRALYGHPDSGTLWEKHCDKALQAQGFSPIENWSSCYWHEEKQLFLCVYVDDFKLSGPTGNLAKGWEMVKVALDIDPPEDAGLYLGCVHEKEKLTITDPCFPKGSADFEVFSWNDGDYLKSTVQRYCTLSKQITGQDVNLKWVATPFIPEEESQLAKPGEECPWCNRAFNLV